MNPTTTLINALANLNGHKATSCITHDTLVAHTNLSYNTHLHALFAAIDDGLIKQDGQALRLTERGIGYAMGAGLVVA